MKVGMAHITQKGVYAEYLRRLDARAILEHYHAQNCREQSGGDGTTEIVHSCLLDRVERHHTNGDSHPSASINLDKKLYCCYAGGWSGDLFHLLMKLEGKEAFSDILPRAGSFLTGATQEASTLRDELDKAFEGQVYHVNLPSYSLRVLDHWRLSHPYLYEERGISVEASTKLRIGYDPRENRIVFPVFWEGNLLGWQKRAIPDRRGRWVGTYPSEPKYRSSSGLPRSEVLYGWYGEKGPLVPSGREDSLLVVESPMSVAKAHSLGLTVPTVATFGSKVSAAQIALLREGDFSTIYVWSDKDPAGLAGEKKLVEGLHRHAHVLVVSPTGGEDLADCDLDAIHHKLQHATPAATKLAEYDTYSIRQMLKGPHGTEA